MTDQPMTLHEALQSIKDHAAEKCSPEVAFLRILASRRRCHKTFWCSTDDVDFDFDYPSTAALANEEPPVMAPIQLLDVDAIQRGIDVRQGLTRGRSQPRRRPTRSPPNSAPRRTHND
jgi:hypothetical protein